MCIILNKIEIDDINRKERIEIDLEIIKETMEIEPIKENKPIAIEEIKTIKTIESIIEIEEIEIEPIEIEEIKWIERPYQTEIIEYSKNKLLEDNKIYIELPTGGGKSYILYNLF